jgi:hypothetical protein
MDLPEYPDFKPLEISDLTLFDRAFKLSPPLISEFTFTNLYSWRQAYKLNISGFENFLIVRSDSGIQKRYFYPIGIGDIRAVVKIVLKDSPGIFIRIPESYKHLFDSDRHFNFELDNDNSDYLYRASDLIDLPGGRYDGKRNLINKFKSMYSHEYVKFSQENILESFEFEEAWCSIKGCENIEGLNNERQAIKEMINNFVVFKLIAAAIKVEDSIRAIAFAQELNPNTMVMHILKADPDILGSYQVMLSEFLAREAQGFEYINLEQDLGIDGLRRSKLSYHPVDMIRKYNLSCSGA